MNEPLPDRDAEAAAQRVADSMRAFTDQLSIDPLRREALIVTAIGLYEVISEFTAQHGATETETEIMLAMTLRMWMESRREYEELCMKGGAS